MILRQVNNLVPLGFVDPIGDACLRYRRDPRRVFPGGWGGNNDPHQIANCFQLRLVDGFADIVPVITGTGTYRGISYREGAFESPIADMIGGPKNAGLVPFRWIEPPLPDGPMCVLLGSWSNEGYGRRMSLAALLHRRGIGSVMPETAYYGARRFPDRGRYPVRTVAETGTLGSAAVTEAASLLAYLRAEGRTSIGAGGYSMGGAHGSLAVALLGEPAAVAGMAPAHSPSVSFVDGMLSRQVDPSVFATGVFETDFETALRSILDIAAITAIPPPACASSAVFIAATGDRFAPQWSTERLHRHWAGSELRYRPGGHISIYALELAGLADAFATSFDRLASISLVQSVPPAKQGHAAAK